MTDLSIDLKSVSQFVVVQADGHESMADTIIHEKEFTDLQEALALIAESEAPLKYLRFNHGGDTYKLYPTEDTGEYTVTKTPILN